MNGAADVKKEHEAMEDSDDEEDGDYGDTGGGDDDGDEDEQIALGRWFLIPFIWSMRVEKNCDCFVIHFKN